MATKTIYHRMKSLNARMIANYHRGSGPARMVLLLTTVGRRSGQPRVTPLQYEEVGDLIYIASARGKDADWFKNIIANPNVHVQISDRKFDAFAEPVTDPVRIAEFLELRLQGHPVMVRMIMHLIDGLPIRFTHADLEAMSAEKAMVILTPLQDNDNQM